MKGRGRTYYVNSRFATQRHAFGVGLNSNCDAFVATVAAARNLPPALERAALAFLNQDAVLRYAKAEFGLK
jgi:hypothetical protein